MFNNIKNIFKKITGLFKSEKSPPPSKTLTPKTIETLKEINAEIESLYRETEQTGEENNWKNLVQYLSRHIPPYGYIRYLSQEEFQNLNDKLERTLSLMNNHIQAKETETGDKGILIDLKKQLLKCWKLFAGRLQQEKEEELAKLIITNGSDEPQWVQFSISHLDKFDNEVPAPYLNQLKELASIKSDDLSKPGNKAFKSVLNTQLALLEKDEYDWTHLNIARLAAIKEDFSLKDTPDDYIVWHLEKAQKAGGELSNIHLIILATIRLQKKEYHETIDILAKFVPDEDKDSLKQQRLLLAAANGKLWLQNHRNQSNGKKAIEIFEDKSLGELPPDENFLFCQLLVGFKDNKRAKNEFAKLDLDRINENKTDIINLAWQLKGYDKIEPFLEKSLEAEPRSVNFLSHLCELYRFHKNKFAEADLLIERIEKLEKKHPWVIVKKCNHCLAAGESESVEQFLRQLPQEGIWAQEAYLVNVRVELKKGSINDANAYLQCIENKNRIDYRYWNAVVNAHMGNTKPALDGISTIADDGYFKNEITGLRGKLLLAEGKYKEALNIFGNLTDGDCNVCKAWCHINLGNYKEVHKLIKRVENEEEIYLKASAYDLAHKKEDAYLYYKRFIREANLQNEYLENVIDRFAYFVIDRKNREDTDWLLKEERLKKYLRVERLIHLYAIEKKWDEVIRLIQSRGEDDNAYSNRLKYAYQELLFNFIEDKKWDEARKITAQLKRLNCPVHLYEGFIVKAELLDDITDDKKEISDSNYKHMKDECIDAILSLRKYMRGKASSNEVRRKIEALAKKNDQRPEPVLLLLIISLREGDSPKAREFAQRLQPHLETIKDREIGLIARMFVSMALGEDRIAIDDLLKVLNSPGQKLPVLQQHFWERFILTLAHENIEKTLGLMAQIEPAVTIPHRSRAALYARHALDDLNKNRELQAVEYLQKAIGE